MVKQKQECQSLWIDDIEAVGAADDIRKGIQNCRRMEIEKKMMYGIRKLNIWSFTQERNQKK